MNLQTYWMMIGEDYSLFTTSKLTHTSTLLTRRTILLLSPTQTEENWKVFSRQASAIRKPSSASELRRGRARPQRWGKKVWARSRRRPGLPVRLEGHLRAWNFYCKTTFMGITELNIANYRSKVCIPILLDNNLNDILITTDQRLSKKFSVKS